MIHNHTYLATANTQATIARANPVGASNEFAMYTKKSDYMIKIQE